MSRIGGAFPFPLAQVAEGGGVITLAPGGVFYPPPGEWIYQTGGTTVMQWFDPINQTWRVLGSASTVDFLSSDGCNYRFINLSGVVAGAAITAAGSAGTNGIGATVTGVSVTFAAPSSGVTATAYAIVGGSVQAPTITQAGSGFLVPPLIVIDPPPVGGVQAAAVATISAAGIITAITMVNVGAGYATSPNFYVVPQFGRYPGGASGSIAAGAAPAPGLVFPANAVPGNQNTSSVGAQLTSAALTGSGTLTGIVVDNNGTNYTGTTIPAVTIAGMTGATATAIMSLSLLSVTLAAGGAGYSTGAPPNFVTSLGYVAGAINGGDLAPRAATGITTLSAGAVATFVVEDPGFGLQKVPVVAVINTSAIGATQATGTAVVGGINDTTILQPRVQ